MAGAQRCQVQKRRFDRLVHLHGNTRSRWKVQTLQQVGQHGSGPLHVAPAVVQSVIGFEGDTIEIWRKGSAQGRKEIVVNSHGGAANGAQAQVW